ncbi:MAG: hypothetical protein U0610_01630 [bacterium]
MLRSHCVRSFVFAAGALALTMLSACGDDSATGLAATPDDTAFVAFDPLGGELRPFPSDLFTAPDPSRPNGRRIAVDTQPIPVFVGLAGDTEMDGFDVDGRMMVALSAAPDEASLPDPAGSTDPAASILLTVADPAAPGFGEPVPFLTILEPLGVAQQPPRYMLMLRALRPLAPSTRYALVITRRLRTAEGGSFGRSPAMQALLSARGVPAELADYGRALRASVEAIARPLALARDQIAAATVFTTASDEASAGGLLRLVDAEIATADVVPAGFAMDGIDASHSDDTTLFVDGHIQAYEYRRADQTFDPARFARVPIPAPRTQLEVIVALPRHASHAPVAIFGHGINSSKEEMRGIGRVLAERGIATVAIDFVEHGSRFTGELIPALAFLSVDWIPGGRDNARQTVADLVQLARAVETNLGDLDVLPEGAPDGQPDVDGSRLGYVGISFGAILGSMFCTVDPSVRVAALLVGGGTWTDIAFGFPPLNSGGDGFGTIAGIADLLNLPVSDVLTLMAVGQSVFAPGDPLTFARWLRDGPPLATRPRQARSVLSIEVMNDQVVNNKSNEALARSIDLPLLVPVARAVPGLVDTDSPVQANGPDGTTFGLVQYQRYLDGTVAEHDNIWGAPEVRDQVAAFVASVLIDGRAPSITAPSTNAR